MMITIFNMQRFAKGTKLLLIATLIILSNYKFAKAQYYGNDYGAMTGGLFGSVTFSQVHGDGFRGFDKFGYAAGGILIFPSNLELPFTGTIAYSLGVQFTQKGARGKNVDNGGIIVKEQVFNLNYAEVPLMIHYYRGHRKSNFGLGLSFGYLAWEETNIDYGSGFVQVENHYKKFDLNMMAGANIHLYQGFFLTAKYQYSLINIKKKNAPTVGRSEHYNDLVSFGLMYVLDNQYK